MNHAGEGLLQAYIDGEVEGEAAASLTAHVETCAECGRELEALRSASAVFHGAMASIGSAAPRIDAARIRTAAARPASHIQLVPGASDVIDISRPRRGVARFAAASMARAAALILVVAGAAAAMIPGSPLRRWLSDRFDRSAQPAVTTTPAPVATPAARRAMVPGAEMSIAPVKGSVQIGISADAGAQIVVRMVESDRATVQTDSSAHAVAFRNAPGRMEILNLGSADALIQLPTSLRSATLMVNGREYLLKDGEGLHVNGPVARRTESEIVFQTGS